MTAKVYVHPAAWTGPTGTLRLLAWAASRGLELVSSRKANIMLVPRAEVPLPHTKRHDVKTCEAIFTPLTNPIPPEMETALINNREQYGVARRICNLIPMDQTNAER